MTRNNLNLRMLHISHNSIPILDALAVQNTYNKDSIEHLKQEPEFKLQYTRICITVMKFLQN